MTQSAADVQPCSQTGQCINATGGADQHQALLSPELSMPTPAAVASKRSSDQMLTADADSDYKWCCPCIPLKMLMLVEAERQCVVDMCWTSYKPRRTYSATYSTIQMQIAARKAPVSSIKTFERKHFALVQNHKRCLYSM